MNAASTLTCPGTLSFNSGTTNLNGAYNIIGNINMLGGTANFGSNGAIGLQTLQVSGGTANVSKGGTALTTILSGGALSSTGAITATSVFTWTGGALSGVGPMNVPASSRLNISGGSSKSLDTRTLNNAGAATWTGTGDVYFSNGAVFNNSGSLDAQNNQYFYYYTGNPAPGFINTGTFNKSGAAPPLT